jgi:hypothetical protein
MHPYKVYLLDLLRKEYADSITSLGRLVIVGKVANLLGSDFDSQDRAQHDLGYPCELLRAVSRCHAHV